MATQRQQPGGEVEAAPEGPAPDGEEQPSAADATEKTDDGSAGHDTHRDDIDAAENEEEGASATGDVASESDGAAGTGTPAAADGFAPRHLRRSRPDEAARRPLAVLFVPAAALVIALFLLAWAIDTAALSGQVARNVEVAGRPVGGLGEASLPKAMSEIASDIAASDVRIVAGDQTYETTAGEIGLTLDENATAEAALAAGRGDSLVTRPFAWLGSFFGATEVPARFAVSEPTAARTLAELQQGNTRAPAEPTIHYDADTGEFGVTPGRSGTGIDVQQVVDELPQAAEESASGDIVVRIDIAEVTPQLTDGAAAELAAEANEMTTGGLTLTIGQADVRVEAAQLRSWIRPAPPSEGFGLAIDEDKVTEELPVLAPSLPSGPRNATVTLSAGGRPQGVPPREGGACCAEDSAERIWEALQAGQTEVALDARVAEPEITTDEAREWGVTQPVGGNRAWRDGAEAPGPAPGFTTYYQPGEPRVTNIHRIADLVRGAVIPPGGTFSINDHVGERTTDKGFVEAGAIRDGQHVPEVGGGVSQFATTTFNAAYFAGLDIEEYQAHSEYFARYPRGREATMGYPNPDLVMHNTTPYGVLIWTSYTDTSLTVTMYSTPYARAEQTAIEESRSGQCTNVETTRTRTYPDSRTDTDAFRATYRPGPGLDCEGRPITPPTTRPPG